MSKSSEVRTDQTAHLEFVSDKRLLRDRERDAAAEAACSDLACGSITEEDCPIEPLAHEYEVDNIPLVFDDLIKAWRGAVSDDDGTSN